MLRILYCLYVTVCSMCAKINLFLVKFALSYFILEGSGQAPLQKLIKIELN